MNYLLEQALVRAQEQVLATLRQPLQPLLDAMPLPLVYPSNTIDELRC
jgi:hypothetical protein